MAIELLASFQTQRMIIRRYSEEAYQKKRRICIRTIFILRVIASTAKKDLNHQNVSCALRNVVNTIAHCNIFR